MHRKTSADGSLDADTESSENWSIENEKNRIVDWDGPKDSQNPKNWTTGKKFAVTVLISLFDFMSPLASSMLAPALPAIGDEFNEHNEIILVMVQSIFVLGFAIGPLFWGPLSEVYGRVRLIQCSNILFLIFNLCGGFSISMAMIIAFRFMAGVCAIGPVTVGAGVLGDLYPSESRGKSIAIYSLAPLLGPALGPILGAFLTKYSTWRVIFYTVTLAGAVVQAVGAFLLKETFGPKILREKKKELIKVTGDASWQLADGEQEVSISSALKTSLSRPFKLLFTQPIVMVLALWYAYLDGMAFLCFATFQQLWQNQYHESMTMSSLNYLSVGAGFIFGSQVPPMLNDKIYASLKRKHSTCGKPEYRIPLMLPGMLLTILGLLLYGWSAQYSLHFLLPNLGAFIFCTGLMTGFQCIQAYALDYYTSNAASAIAALTVLKCLAGTGFPLFAPRMYQVLDYGWGNTVLAGAGTVIGLPAIWLLWRYGEVLRKRSTFAVKEEEGHF
ncbi:MFS general substrate transporter [Aulographum hederae CBS 113979]|uniref:MFS general substrate transporter n=1 Tax=Aulographum hederae CBS 113979 TaxID=1176131 RepID=A0A6G1H3L4_9PEZI|nr:MFS general substrate transporter [Aulographum hederae CBS 113979]